RQRGGELQSRRREAQRGAPSPLGGRGLAEVSHHFLEISPYLALRSGVPEQVRRVEGRHDRRRALVELPRSTQARDALARADKPLPPRAAEPHYDLRPHQGELRREKRRASCHLVRLGLAFLGRPALDDVADVHVVATVAHPPDHLVEELTRRAHEGLTE